MEDNWASAASAFAMDNNTIQSLTTWTDDIPICKQAGIGSANNEIYRKDGRRVEMHPLHTRTFHFRSV